MTETITLHELDGTIRLCWVRQAIDDPTKYIGTLPYAWIDPKDHKAVKAAIAAAGKGKTVTCRYTLQASLYGGHGWQVETEWLPSGSKDRPILGVSRTYMAVLGKLTAKERELIKLLGSDDPKRRNDLLHAKKSTTHRSAKTRLARKLGISTAQLPAHCAAICDLV